MTRGVAAEDINWEYVPEKKIQPGQLALFFAIVILVIPGVMYLISVEFYQNTIDNMKGAERGMRGFFVDKFLFVSMLGLDQGALYVIEKMLPSSGFLKEHQVVGLKFLSTNLYFLSSGLFFLILGLVVAANDRMAEIQDKKQQFLVTKQLLDSFYLTFVALILTNINSHIVMPAYRYYSGGKKTKVPRDISYPLSFMCLAIYYVVFFAPFDSNVILIMFVTVLGLFLAEIALLYLGVVEPSRINFTVIGNYLLALIWGTLPVSLSAYLMLEGNQMGIRAFSLRGRDAMWVICLLALFVVTAVLYTILYKNERLLRRTQSMIWNINESLAAPAVLQGASYRSSNPVYTFEGKAKFD